MDEEKDRDDRQEQDRQPVVRVRAARAAVLVAVEGVGAEPEVGPAR